jgi:hypothetical protein
MNWIDWLKSYPITTEQRDLYFMLILLIVAFLCASSPKRSDYKNFFVAWIVFLILIVFEVGLVWFFYFFRIFPDTLGSVFYDQVFCVIIFLLCFFAMKRLMVVITKRLKIYKDEN